MPQPLPKGPRRLIAGASGLPVYWNLAVAFAKIVAASPSPITGRPHLPNGPGLVMTRIGISLTSHWFARKRHAFVSARACIVLLAFAASSTSTAIADRFVMHNGAEIHGIQATPLEDEAVVDNKTLVVRTEEGPRITLLQGQLRTVIRDTATELEYERLAPGVANNVVQQWKLCEWCRQRGLKAQRKAHLRRILELDPDHVLTRHALGYSEVNGAWVTQADHLRRRGYQLYRGRWRLSQEIERIEERSKRELAERRWMVRLKRWRGQVSADNGREFAKRLEQLRDLRAVPALLHFCQGESLRPVKRLYLDALHEIGAAPAIEGMVQISLNDPDAEVFHECVDRLERNKPAAAVQIYIKALEDPNNVRLNRAANALGRLADRQAIPPLIAALITRHKVVIAPPGRGAADTIRSSFQRGGGSASNPLGGAGLSTGGGVRVFHQTASNREVLEALTRLSGGVTFGYNQRAWRNWLAQEQHNASPTNLQRR